MLNPATPADAVAWVLDLTDTILVMTVNPGFGGQEFLPSQLPKIAALRQMIQASARPIALAVDGGITPATARQAVAAGADTLIAGTVGVQGTKITPAPSPPCADNRTDERFRPATLAARGAPGHGPAADACGCRACRMRRRCRCAIRGLAMLGVALGC